MNASRLPRLAAAGLLVAIHALAISPARAQLRPYDPIDWAIYDEGRSLSASVGTSTLWDQRASLAGTEGRLHELGMFQASTRVGRIDLEAAGTIYRILIEERSFAPPVPSTDPKALGRRGDHGDYRLSTTVMLTPAAGPAAAVLRFGTRIPTTDNRVGLERDQTDFFALLGGRVDHGALRASLELGVGIHGTREPDFEQSDVLVYATTLTFRSGAIQPSLVLLGHSHGTSDRVIRGNEDLSEVRLQVRAGRNRWVQLQATRGLTPFSPAAGLTITAGMAR